MKNIIPLLTCAAFFALGAFTSPACTPAERQTDATKVQAAAHDFCATVNAIPPIVLGEAGATQ
jgi:hypothetical protein